MDALDRLYDSLDARLRPEDVAVLVREALPSLTRRQRSVINEVAAHASRWHGFTGMSTDYARPVGAARQVAATRVVFGVDTCPVDATIPSPCWSSPRSSVPRSTGTWTAPTSSPTG
ncbi:hypothetical protein [Lentzea atacamensis]|uniref:hypothetical protein n=1 Tax=Lentzea atacamensis TaxID=531938 RepID=UPI000DD2D037|nr:hypothetical protein [Lentzea atacamensis]